MSHLLLLVTCSESEGNLDSTTFSAFLAEAAQSKGKLGKLQRNPLKGRKWQKPPKAKENLENCRENKPYAICLYVVTRSNSAGNLGNGRKKLGLVCRILSFFILFFILFVIFFLSFFYPFFILLAAKWIKIGFPRYKRQSVGFYPFLSFLFNLFLSFVYPFFILLAAKWIKIGFPRYKRQRAEEKCRILSFFILFLILCLSFFYPFLWWHKSATVFWKKRCLGSDTHTNSWHAILMLSCFIAKNSTQSDGRFRRLSRYSIFICHLFSWHIYAISLLPYIRILYNYI